MDRLVLPDVPAHVLLPPEMELQRLNAENSQSFRPIDRCVTCAGRQTFMWWSSPDRQEVAEWECNCADQFLLHRFMASRGFGLHHGQMMWSDIQAVPPSVIEWANSYRANADELVRRGMGVALLGNNGTGKSIICALFLKNLIRKGMDGYFSRALDFFSGVADGWKNPDYKTWFTRRIKNAQVLVLDDLGKETMSYAARGGEEAVSATLAGRILEDTLRYRMGNLLPTFITSNLTVDQISARYGASILETLIERSQVVDVVGQSWRSEQRRRLDSEIANGLSRPLCFGEL